MRGIDARITQKLRDQFSRFIDGGRAGKIWPSMKEVGHVVEVLVVSVLALAVVALGWVRLAPIPSSLLTARPGPDAPGLHRLDKGVKAVLPLHELPDEAWAHMVDVAQDTPRTDLVSRNGTEATLVMRSRRLGLPSVISIWIEGDALHVFAQAVHTHTESGENEDRIRFWLRRLVEAKDEDFIANSGLGV